LHELASRFDANSPKVRKKTQFISTKFRFTKMHHPTSFYTKTNPRENGLFVSEWAVGDKKATHNVKTYAIYFTSPQDPLL
jgi:hypothetical protein